MPRRQQKTTPSNALVCILAVLTISSSAYAADLFRWQDEQGNTHYTDQVPPQYLEQGYRVISEQGLTIRTIKSAAEIESTQKPVTPEIPKQQTAQDQRLLMTYSSEDEIIATRDRKLADTEAMMNLTRETISLLDVQFRELAKKAGDFEKKGEAVPEPLLKQISITKKKIEKHQLSVEQGSANMAKIKQELDETQRRYRQLKSAMDNIE